MGNQISLIKLSLFFFCLPSSPFVSSECVCVCDKLVLSLLNLMGQPVSFSKFYGSLCH